MRWTAIWHNEWPLLAPPDQMQPDARLAELTLFLELTVPPLKGRKPLRLWQGASDPRMAIGLYLMPDGGLRLVHGGVDLQTAPDFTRAGETICLRYRACARGRNDVLDLRNPDRQLRQRLRAAFDQPLTVSDALPRDPQFLKTCHIAAIAPFGVAPTDMPGLAAETPIETPAGPMRIDQLQPGMDVLDANGTAVSLRWIEGRPRMCLGRMAPIQLRAPYFGLQKDVRVTPQTRILRSGPIVEYICGTDAVLVQAGDMANSPAAKRDQHQPVQVFYHLMLDDHACVLVDRCPLETALLAEVIQAEDMAPRPFLTETDKSHYVPVLDRAAAQALVTAGSKGRRAMR